MTVNQVSKLTGVSIRTLQYYDKIGLLHPTMYTKSHYRLYDDTVLEQLQQILLFRELEFSLKDIKKIIDSPDFDKNKALKQQIELLTLKKEHLETLIELARGINMTGDKTMDFTAFDTSKIDEYAKRAKEQWGETPAFKEFEEKSEHRTKKNEQNIMNAFMKLFEEFGKLKASNPASEQSQNQVKKLQQYINQNFYSCTDEILFSLGQMYSDCGEFTENIDRAGGKGTAEFTTQAIRIYCGK